ncbi:hypothetical protein PHYBOEH_003437 [Phytophthora boehmeriae]|uniref:Myb-like DNA-binding protein n=1 Tax=Phytophthora boehmeriae TaxID=109152 RepID=A0A8T1WVC9_9STRA|nr:hypothetical protein PHYBOEH_003437 [Phytophthora boehmeriae]
MSISVSRESISKLMGELVETFPMEAEGRSSISDFGKLLFTEGQASTGGPGVSKADAAVSKGPSNGSQTQTGSKRVFTEIKGVPRQKQHDIMKTKDKAVPKRWTQEEDDKLREAVGRHGERNWKSIAEEVPGRNHTQCLQRWTKVLAPGLVKGHWRPDEDDLLKELVAEGRKNWGQVATRIPGRTSKQCRERWYNHLDPSIVRGEYTPEEDRMILDAQARLGNRWSAIAAMLPGRTEDAVKIRWKSLCRVRKGQGRRGQVDKNKMASKAMMGVPGHMMQGPGFDNGMVKSEEVGAFSMHQGPQMMRLANGQMVPASSMQGGHQHHQTMSMMGGMGTQGMMYPSDMSGGGYDPTMVHYRKPPMQQHVVDDGYGHSLPPARNNGQDYVDRRSNMVNMSSNGMPMPSQPQDEYRQTYQGSSSGYTPNNGMYSDGPSPPNERINNGQMYGAAPQMNSYRPRGAMYDSQLSPHHPSQVSHSSHPQSQMMSYNYDLPPAPAGERIGGAGPAMNNPAAAFAQQQQHRPPQRQHQQYTDHSPPISHHMPQQERQLQAHIPMHAQMQRPIREREQPNPEQEPPSPRQHHDERTRDDRVVKDESRTMANPAAMFARSQSAKASPANGNSSHSPAANSNPVAAFMQQQHQQQKRKEQPAGANKQYHGPSKPFNPAAAFAQRFQAMQRPPMPSSGANSTRSNDDDEDGGNASGGDRTNEPSLKKVKPRLSIDAARASAARRLRNSGNGGNLAGRGSLDVFLNEIGDVGRLSDLKMDEFQTLDELWRVSGDMDRLSL